jgi:hypothetical protein
MVICKIWDADIPDVRVEKLKLCGKNTQSACVPQYQAARDTKADGIYIHRLPFIPLNLGWLNRVIGFPAFFNPVWLFTVWRVVRRYRANVILIRDLPLALTALLIGRWMGIPVALDMAENYPAMIEDLWSKKFRLINYFVRNPALVRLVEKICVRHVDHIFVVVESRRRLIGLGVPRENICGDEFQSGCSSMILPVQKAAETNPTQSCVSFTLDCSNGLEIETAIRAIQAVRPALPRIKLLVVSGRDGDTSRRWRWKPTEISTLSMAGLSRSHRTSGFADIGLVRTMRRRAGTRRFPINYLTICQWVSRSSCQCHPIERIVTDENCGIVFPEKDAKAPGDAIIKLSAREFGRSWSAREDAVMREYNWCVDEERLFRALERSLAREFR